MKNNFINPFKSFWMGGYECADHLNAFGNRVDLSVSSGHLDLLDEDYARLRMVNIETVREGLRWSHIEKQPYQYCWNVAGKMIKAAAKQNIQLVWDICHFGFPDDLTPLHPMFARRFASFCRAFVKFYRTIEPEKTLIITPINEVSFLSWLGGDARGTSPYCNNQGWAVKYNLMKAYIEGIEAIKEIDPTVLILVTEPLINVTAPYCADDLQKKEAEDFNRSQFQVLEILSGNMFPELRGKPEYIDIVGFNFYADNQWVFTTNTFLNFKNNDPAIPGWKPLSELLIDAYNLYQWPIIISETSHTGEFRSEWIKMVADECRLAVKKNVPLLGICIYPLIDRPDWDDLSSWHHSGIWDIEEGNNLSRKISLPYSLTIKNLQNLQFNS